MTTKTYDFRSTGRGQTTIKEEVLGQEEKKKPIAKFKCGGVTATVWENKSVTNEAEWTTRTVTLSRTYKTRSGEWKESNSYNLSGVQRARRVLDLAEAFMLDAHEEEREVD